MTKFEMRVLTAKKQTVHQLALFLNSTFAVRTSNFFSPSEF